MQEPLKLNAGDQSRWEEVAPWTEELLEIMHIAERCVATTFNSVLADLYQDGRDFGVLAL